MNNLSSHKKNNNFALAILLLSVLIASVSIGINAIAFPSVLIEHKIPAFFIGLSSTNEIIFGLIGAVLITKITRIVSSFSAMIGVAIIHGTMISLIFFYQNYYLWILLSGIAGACGISLFVLRQSWINNVIFDNNRSIFIALTTMIFCFGFIIGSFIVDNFGALNHITFLTSAGLVLIANFLPIIIKKTQPNSLHSEPLLLKNFIKRLPNESLARFLLDFQITLIVCLGVVFGTKIGLSLEQSGLLIAAFMASGFFDLYAGFLVKKYNRQLMIVAGFACCLITVTFAFYFHAFYYLLLFCFFAFGASCALILVATLTIANESFDKSQVVAANGALQAIGSFGGICGCLLGGLALQFLDFYGFFLVMASANLVYLYYFSHPRYKSHRKKIRLGVNIDHVATIRNARGGIHPSPVKAAILAQKYGADGITIHLREDRRHIRDEDLVAIKKAVKLPINLEMAPTKEMLEIALKTAPNAVCIVPEKRQEVTTEGGLDVASNFNVLRKMAMQLKQKDIRVSLFVDPDLKQIKAAKDVGADIIEIHTGEFCRLFDADDHYGKEFMQIQICAKFANEIGLECHAGHGLNYESVRLIARIKEIKELNIGHFLIGEAIFDGLRNVVRKMKVAIG